MMVRKQTEADPDSSEGSGSIVQSARGYGMTMEQMKAGMEKYLKTGRASWLRRIGLSAGLAYLTTTTPVLGQLAAGIELVCATPLGQAFNVIVGLFMLGCIFHSIGHFALGGIKLRPGGGGMQGQSEGRSLLLSGAASLGAFLFVAGYPAVLAYFGQSLTGCVGF